MQKRWISHSSKSHCNVNQNGMIKFYIPIFSTLLFPDPPISCLNINYVAVVVTKMEKMDNWATSNNSNLSYSIQDFATYTTTSWITCGEYDGYRISLYLDWNAMIFIIFLEPKLLIKPTIQTQHKTTLFTSRLTDCLVKIKTTSKNREVKRRSNHFK